jgi:integrase
MNEVSITLIELGWGVEAYSPKELAEYLKNTVAKRGKSDNELDFIRFMMVCVDEMKTSGKDGTYRNYYLALSKIKKYAGDTLPFEKMTVNFLETFEKHLSESGTGKTAIAQTMSCFRKIFNDARNKFNDEDNGVIAIKNYPFSKYKMPETPQSKKRAAGMDVVLKMLKYVPRDGTEEFAKDMFLLSFYLVGMNAADMYDAEPLKNGRITYCRRKTKDTRKDCAEISIHIEPEAKPLIEKYRDETGEKLLNLHQRYKSATNLNMMIGRGFRQIREVFGAEDDLTFYSARHSWASIASNDCDIIDGKIARCLNHVCVAHKTTNRDIKKDWTVIDNCNRKVIDRVTLEIKKS